MTRPPWLFLPPGLPAPPTAPGKYMASAVRYDPREGDDVFVNWEMGLLAGRYRVTLLGAEASWLNCVFCGTVPEPLWPYPVEQQLRCAILTSRHAAGAFVDFSWSAGVFRLESWVQVPKDTNHSPLPPGLQRWGSVEAFWDEPERPGHEPHPEANKGGHWVFIVKQKNSFDHDFQTASIRRLDENFADFYVEDGGEQRSGHGADWDDMVVRLSKIG